MSQLFIDNGNYPTIFANDALVERLGDGMVCLVLIEARQTGTAVERHVVGRIIRPAVSVKRVSRHLSQELDLTDLVEIAEQRSGLN